MKSLRGRKPLANSFYLGWKTALRRAQAELDEYQHEALPPEHPAWAEAFRAYYRAQANMIGWASRAQPIGR